MGGPFNSAPNSRTKIALRKPVKQERHMDQESSSLGARMNDGIAAPLRFPVYRRIWLASLLSNFGLLIQGVGAAWAMTELARSPEMVALVQTALMLPVMLVAIPAGAAADMYDRRWIIIVALLISLSGASMLSALAFFELISPTVLLLLTFVIGSGMALFGPAWQASVSEQVSVEALPSAVALNSISFNIARSFGPAIGGMIVATLGAVAAFVANALLYLPLLIVLLRWRRVHEPPRLPPERMARAIISGARYIVHSPAIRVVLVRTFITGVAGACVSALMPMVARDLVGGGAQTYGFMLGCFGVGAVAGALNLAAIRRRLTNERILCLCAISMGVAICIVALSRSIFLTGGALISAGAAWMISVTLYNVAIQLSIPRWVAGRALAGFQASIAGGIAIGSWLWGYMSASWSVQTALLLSGAVMALLSLLGLWRPLPEHGTPADEAREGRSDPEISLKITGRSGPIVIEIDYQVRLEEARPFYRTMQQVQLVRQRNGAYDWSLSRDIAAPELWTERYSCPTWLDYLRLRDRATEAERRLELDAHAFRQVNSPLVVRRRLERPLGSVRWRDDTPDRQSGTPSQTVLPGL
jgi:MFS family permease